MGVFHLKKRRFACSVILLTVLLSACHSNKTTDTTDLSDNLTETLQELYPDEGWEVAGKLKADRTIHTFSDSEGNEILFHVISAVEMSGEIEDEQFYQAVLDPVLAETAEQRMVGPTGATLYTKNGRSYLCWRPENAVALILDYDPSAVSASDIIRMAESAEQVDTGAK